MQDQDTTAIKCQECGAPSYFDQKSEGFMCPYCGNFAPWATADYRYTLDMIFRHRPLPVIDGLLKLTHVGVGETAVKDMRSPDEMKKRTSSLDDLLSEYDKGTFEKWDQREEKSYDCPYCSARITGFSTQSVFKCAYCGNKIMPSEVFESGLYGENLVYGYDPNMYDLVLPFKVTKEQAIEQLLRLVAQNRSDFEGQDIEKRIRSELQAIYLPHWVEDFSVKATVDTERGRFTFYQDRINWARPQCSLFDIYLLNQLNPWDYGESAPFTPAFLEDDVRIFAPMNNEERVTAPYRMLYRDIPDMLKSTFGLNEVKMLGWVTNFRRHKYASVNLPIWFLDKASWSRESDLQTRMAVNAQTGKAAALFLESGKKDYTRTLDPDPPPIMSDECTLYSPPLPVKYVKPSFLFKTMDINQALGKPRSKFRSLFDKKNSIKFRTFIALCVHLVLAAALIAYILFFHVDSSVKNLEDSDIRIVIDSQEEFDQAIKTDGRIYALGEMRGTISLSDISLDDLDYGGKDKAEKVQEIVSSLDGNYIYISFFSEILSEETVKEEDPFKQGEYVWVTRIVGEPYAFLDFYDTFSFYGYDFPNTQSLMVSFYDQMESTLVDGRAEEHVISAVYLPDKQPMWLELTVSKGQIDRDSLVLHSTNSSFDYAARRASGNSSSLEIIGGILIVAAISFAVTVAIQRKFGRFSRY